MPQKDQGLGTNGTWAKDNDEAPGGQQPSRPEEYISFQTLLIQTDQDTLVPQHTLYNPWDSVMLLLFLFASMLEELLGSFFCNSCLEAVRCSAGSC